MNSIIFNTLPDQLIIQMFESNVGASIQVNKRFYKIFNAQFQAINEALASNDQRIKNIINDKKITPITISGIPSSLTHTKLIYKYLNSLIEDEGFFLTANTVYNESRVNWAYKHLINIPPFLAQESKKDLPIKAEDFRYFMVCLMSKNSSALVSTFEETMDSIVNASFNNRNQQHNEELSRYPEDLQDWETMRKSSRTLLIPHENYQLHYLPKEIGDITNLQKLDLNGHRLKNLPAQLKDLKLTTLFLNKNPFGTFPSVILKITTLKTLSLAYCELTSIPDAVENLIGLKILNISGNKLNNLPASFKNLKNLKELDISHNPWKGGFPAVLEELPKLKILIVKGKTKEGMPKKILDNPNIHVIGKDWEKKPASIIGKITKKFNKTEKKDSDT